MSYYYLMSTAEKDAVLEDQLECVPNSNIQGDFWIVESNVTGLQSVIEFESVTNCIEYIKTNASDWDEFLNI